MGNDIEIRLERTDRSYWPGEVVKGEVLVRAGAPVETNGLSVALNWVTAGSGNQASGQEQRRLLHRGSLSGESAWPFELVVPPGPLSYEGNLLQVRWQVEATIDISWAIDPTKREQVRVLPPATPCALDVGPEGAYTGALPISPQTMKTVAGGCGGCMFLGHGLAFVLVGLANSEVIPAVGGGLAIVAAFVMLYFLVLRNVLAQRKLGPVTVEVPSAPASPGSKLPVKVRFTPAGWVQLNSAKATLLGYERVVRGSGKNSQTRRHEFAKQEVVLSTGQSISAGEPVELVGSFSVPEEAPVTFAARSNAILWEVHVHLDLAGWPDYVQETPLIVLPAGCSARGAT